MVQGSFKENFWMKARCIELEASNVEFQRAYEQVDEDRADVIAYLQRQLQSKECEIIELNERLEGVQKQLEETIIKYEAKIKQMGLEYRNMSEQLTSEVKLLIGKLNAIEEFRTQRDELMAKFKQQKEDMERQVEENRQAVYEVEKKFVVGKDKLKKEMEARLLKLAMDFQDSTQLRITATTHRVIRENIALNNELDEMLETHRNLVNENNKLRLAAERNRTLALMYEEQKNVITNRNNIQLDLINRLTVEHEKMLSIMGDLQHSKQRVAVLENQLAVANSLLEKSVAYTNVADEEILSRSHDNNLLTNELNRADANIVMLQKVLVNARNLVDKAVKLQETMPEEEAYRAIQESDLLNNLVMLFNTADLASFEETGRRVKSVLMTSAIYGMGDVGLLRDAGVSRTSAVAPSEAWTAGSQPSKEGVKGEQGAPSFHFLSVESIKPSKSSSSAAEIGGEESSEEEPGEQELAGEAVDWLELAGEGEYGEGYEIGGEGEGEYEGEETRTSEETEEETSDETEEETEENKTVEGEETQISKEEEEEEEEEEEGTEKSEGESTEEG